MTAKSVFIPAEMWKESLDAEKAEVSRLEALVDALGKALGEAERELDEWRKRCAAFEARIDAHNERYDCVLVDRAKEAEATTRRLELRIAELGRHLPVGLFKEYGRLDVMWQALVAEKDAAKVEARRLREALEAARDGFRDIADNYDCDKGSGVCRVCSSRVAIERIDAALAGTEAQS